MTYEASMVKEAFSAFNITEHKDASINPFFWAVFCRAFFKEGE